MKKMNKILSVMMAAAMTVSMTACGGDTASDNTSASADNSAATTESAAAGSTDGQKYTIGILQQLEHPALDAASQGFEDALTELLGADNVTFDLQNAQGEQANCATIANNFVAGNYDLILQTQPLLYSVLPLLQARSRSLELLSQIMQLPLRSTTGQVLPEEISPELPILLL